MVSDFNLVIPSKLLVLLSFPSVTPTPNCVYTFYSCLVILGHCSVFLGCFFSSFFEVSSFISSSSEMLFLAFLAQCADEYIKVFSFVTELLISKIL